MNIKHHKHPTIAYHGDISAICSPLKKMGISYFAHVNIQNNAFSALTNNPAFQCHYIDNQYYNADIHMASSGLINDFFVWDAVERRGKSLQLHQEAAQFGVKHTFTIHEKDFRGDNYYHFATSEDNHSINHLNLSNRDLLKLFIMHFGHLVGQSKRLSKAYQITYDINPEQGSYSIDETAGLNKMSDMRQSFIQDLKLGDTIQLVNGQVLSSRQIEILNWLHHGKTISDIAKIVGLAEITINKHIHEIKHKLKCYTHFQLGEFFSSMLGTAPSSLLEYFQFPSNNIKM